MVELDISYFFGISNSIPKLVFPIARHLWIVSNFHTLRYHMYNNDEVIL